MWPVPASRRSWICSTSLPISRKRSSFCSERQIAAIRLANVTYALSRLFPFVAASERYGRNWLDSAWNSLSVYLSFLSVTQSGLKVFQDLVVGELVSVLTNLITIYVKLGMLKASLTGPTPLLWEFIGFFSWEVNGFSYGRTNETSPKRRSFILFRHFP